MASCYGTLPEELARAGSGIAVEDDERACARATDCRGDGAEGSAADSAGSGVSRESGARVRRWGATSGAVMLMATIALAGMKNYGSPEVGEVTREEESTPPDDRLWKTHWESAPTAELFNVSRHAKFPLAFLVNVELSATGYFCVEYRRADDPSAEWLWTPWTYNAGTGSSDDGNSSGASTESLVFRLRARQTYDLRLWTRQQHGGAHEVVASTQQSTPSTGIDAFDYAPLAKVRGNATFTLIQTDHAISDAADGTGWDTFGGLVMFDNEGWVVWYYSFIANGGKGSAQVNDQLDNFNIVFNSEEDDTKLHEIDPLGQVVSSFDLVCDDTNHSTYHSILHEARADKSRSPEPVMALKNRISQIPGHKAYQLVDGVGVWDRANGTFETLYWLDDYFDVINERGIFSDQSKSIGCTTEHWTKNKQTFNVQDWSHANSIFSSTTGDVLVSIRNLDAVIALARDGSGKRWVLSGNPNVTSDFEFDPPDGRFWSQHDVTMLSNGNLFVMDNGDTRPGCNAHKVDGNCWSRGAEYFLNFTSMRAQMVWEFRPNHPLDEGGSSQAFLYSKAKGSVTEVSDGSRLIAFPAVVWQDETSSQSYHNVSFFIYQVDDSSSWQPDEKEQHVKSSIVIDSDLQTGWPYPYRAVHRESVFGEQSTMHSYSETTSSTAEQDPELAHLSVATTAAANRRSR